MFIKMMTRPGALHAAFVATIAIALHLPAQAQSYPGRGVKIVVPYPAGSSPDALARILGDNLSKLIKQAVVVENKPGAGGMIGAKMVAEAAPDGNTLLMFTPAWSAAKVFQKRPMVSVPDGLEPVTMVAEGRFALTVAGALPAKNFNELVSYAKTNPGKLNFATTGLGDSLLYFHNMQQEKGIKIETVQYKGSAEYVTAMVANEVQMAFTPEYSMLPFVKDGRLKVLAVTGDKRSKVYPDAPTFLELGLPRIRNNWMSIFAPKGTPVALVNKINADLVSIINSPEGSARIHDIYFEPVGSSPDHLRRRILTEIEEWSTLAKSVGIQPE